MTKKKIIPLVLILVGVAFLLGAIISWFDNLTASEPVGLGKWIFDIFVAFIGASSGIKGWLDWNKKENPPQVTKITANDNAQVATGDHGRNIRQGDNSQYIENFHEAPKPERQFSSPLRLPPPPADFTGREEIIQELLKDFESHKGANISGLTGMGGIGKTVLGLVVAHRIAQQYPDGQIMIDLKGTTTPLSTVDAIRQIILLLEPQMDVRGLDESNMVAFYQSVLDGKKILLFLDNARSAEQIAPLCPPETCALLVTSRWNFAVAGLKTHKVGVLSESESVNFLLELCPRIDENASELAKSCAYLPLALRIAGSFLNINTNWKIEKYLKELNGAKGKLATFAKSRADAELTTEPDLLATFELSYNQLKEEQKKNWRELGVFPASFFGNSAAAMWKMGEEEANNQLTMLLRYSLIDFNEIPPRYEMHDLLAEYARSEMEVGEEAIARQKHASHYKEVMRFADTLYLEGNEKILLGLRLFDLEWENIRVAHSWLVDNINQSKEIAELAMFYPNVSVHCLDLRLSPKQIIEWLQIALDAARKLKDRRYESAHLNSLGLAYEALGDSPKAIELHKQALMTVRRIGDRRGEGYILDNLGIEYADLGEARKAIEFYEKALIIHREIGERRGEGQVLGNLGNAYKDLGDAHKAIEFYEQALVIDREIGERRGEGVTLGNLGLAYAALDDVRKAIDLYEQALIIARIIGDRRGEGNALGNLGNAYKKLGENKKGIEYVEEALEIFESLKSPYAIKAKSSLKNWGALE